jgi:hypothetical protein
MNGAPWPRLPIEEWHDTCDTLHMWAQVVGKLTLRTTPLVNHYWNVTYLLTSRGLATRPMTIGRRTLVASFDFVAHELRLDASDGVSIVQPLEPMTVADFHARTMESLTRLGTPIHIWTMPQEVPDPIPFDKDTVHRSYDRAWANAFWRALEAMRPVFEEFRAGFIGKSSPVHFFWGSFDLALTRFSGHRAPEKPGADPIVRESYSHEVISHGFWPGGGDTDASFYAYVSPEPEGFATAAVAPAAARYDPQFKEFLLPYDEVRSAVSPDTKLLAFLRSTYDAAADLARWDRASLER